MGANIFVIHRIFLLDPLNLPTCPQDSSAIFHIFTNYKCMSWINQILDIGFNIILLIIPKLSHWMLILICDVFYSSIINNLCIKNIIIVRDSIIMKKRQKMIIIIGINWNIDEKDKPLTCGAGSDRGFWAAEFIRIDKLSPAIYVCVTVAF